MHTQTHPYLPLQRKRSKQRPSLPPIRPTHPPTHPPIHRMHIKDSPSLPSCLKNKAQQKAPNHCLLPSPPPPSPPPPPPLLTQTNILSTYKQLLGSYSTHPPTHPPSKHKKVGGWVGGWVSSHPPTHPPTHPLSLRPVRVRKRSGCLRSSPRRCLRLFVLNGWVGGWVGKIHLMSWIGR